jgi:hypothetical protein
MVMRFVCAKWLIVPLQYGSIGHWNLLVTDLGRPVSFHYHPFETTAVE